MQIQYLGMHTTVYVKKEGKEYKRDFFCKYKCKYE